MQSIFKSAAILDKKFKSFTYISFQLSKILSIVILHSAIAFHRYQIYQMLLNVKKVMMGRKISIMNKKNTIIFHKDLKLSLKRQENLQELIY